MKSFKAKELPQDDSKSDPDERPATEGRNAEVDFHGEKRSNETHASTTDPDARLYRKSPGQGAKLCFIGYAVSQRIRKRIEEVFGWTKTVAGQRKTRLRGLPRVRWAFTFAMAAYNLIRLPKLLGAIVA